MLSSQNQPESKQSSMLSEIYSEQKKYLISREQENKVIEELLLDMEKRYVMTRLDMSNYDSYMFNKCGDSSALSAMMKDMDTISPFRFAGLSSVFETVKLSINSIMSSEKRKCYTYVITQFNNHMQLLLSADTLSATEFETQVNSLPKVARISFKQHPVDQDLMHPCEYQYKAPIPHIEGKTLFDVVLRSDKFNEEAKRRLANKLLELGYYQQYIGDIVNLPLFRLLIEHGFNDRILSNYCEDLNFEHNNLKHADELILWKKLLKVEGKQEFNAQALYQRMQSDHFIRMPDNIEKCRRYLECWSNTTDDKTILIEKMAKLFEKGKCHYWSTIDRKNYYTDFCTKWFNGIKDMQSIVTAHEKIREIISVNARELVYLPNIKKIADERILAIAANQDSLPKNDQIVESFLKASDPTGMSKFFQLRATPYEKYISMRDKKSEIKMSQNKKLIY